MTHVTLPALATLLVLVHAVRVDQLDRDDPAHASRRLLADLSAALGR